MYSPEISWLLESKVPSIRFKTYKNLVGFPIDHPVMVNEFQNIQSSSIIQNILDHQEIPGQWPYINHFYTPKYVSTHWSLILLEELMVDPNEARFQQAVEYMISKTHQEIEKRFLSGDRDWTCLWGNILRYVVYAGSINDPRVKDLITFISQSVIHNECSCTINENRPCSWGLIRSLWGLGKIPVSVRNIETQKAIDIGVLFLLEKYSLVDANFPTDDSGKIHPLWKKLSFPLFYQSDILFVLRLLAELALLDHPKSQPVIDWLLSRRRSNGHFKGSNPFRNRTWPVILDQEDNDRWITLFALDVLQKKPLIKLN